MKKLTRVLSGVLAGLMVLGLAACGGTSAAPAATTAAPATTAAAPAEDTTAAAALDADVQAIVDRGVLRVGVKNAVLGFGYQDPITGEYSGMEIDLANALAAQLGVDIAQAIVPAVDTAFKFVLCITAPFNLLKWVVISVVTALIYKPLSPILHGRGKTGGR